MEKTQPENQYESGQRSRSIGRRAGACIIEHTERSASGVAGTACLPKRYYDLSQCRRAQQNMDVHVHERRLNAEQTLGQLVGQDREDEEHPGRFWNPRPTSYKAAQTRP